MSSALADVQEFALALLIEAAVLCFGHWPARPAGLRGRRQGETSERQWHSFKRKLNLVATLLAYFPLLPASRAGAFGQNANPY